MFRRLFAIETAALQNTPLHGDDCEQRQDHSAHPLGDSLADLFRYAATPCRYGMWSARAAH